MGRIVDLTGQKFGKLTVIKLHGFNKRNKAIWECKCDCGSDKIVMATNSNLRNWKLPSCGCWAKEIELENKKRERIGKTYNKLTIIDYAYTKDNITYWKCKCNCGNKELIILPYSKLTSGQTKSCGCLFQDNLKKIRSGEKQPPNLKHGDTGTRLYHIYSGMKDRCCNKRNKDYADYGGRGIKVCKEWYDSYTTFKKWAISNGYQDNLTIDRKDVNGNYCPENCRWTDIIQQNNNKRTNIIIKYNGRNFSLKQLSELIGINYQTLYDRYKKGWALERMIQLP